MKIVFLKLFKDINWFKTGEDEGTQPVNSIFAEYKKSETCKIASGDKWN
jgi:hypothetical protein